MKKTLKPYIDTHTHFLFGVDDGPVNIEESLKMLEAAIADGMAGAVLTNHFHGGAIEYQELADRHFHQLVEAVEAKGLKVALYRGNELYLSEETVAAARQGWAESMNRNGTLLVELPRHAYDPAIEAMVHDIQAAGFKVLIAHAERCGYLFSRPDVTEMLVRKGCLFQVNSEAFEGRKLRKAVMAWIAEGKVACIASDCHDLKKRPPGLSKVYRYISRKLGEEAAQDLFYNNAAKILGIDKIGGV